MMNNNFDNFGYYLLAFLYLAMAISSLFAVAVVNKIGLQRTFFFGGMGHFLFIASMILASWKFDF